MAKRILDYDPASGITRWFDYVPETDTSVVYTEQDVGLILEANKALANDEDYSRKGIKESWWHYATIPNIVIEKWLNEHGVNVYDRDHERKVYELLNRPEYKYLKTTSKRHWA